MYYARFLDETSFVEGFVTGGAGGSGTGLGVAAVDISRTLAGAVFRVADFAAKAGSAAAVVTGICSMLTAGFI